MHLHNSRAQRDLCDLQLPIYSSEHRASLKFELLALEHKETFAIYNCTSTPICLNSQLLPFLNRSPLQLSHSKLPTKLLVMCILHDMPCTLLKCNVLIHFKLNHLTANCIINRATSYAIFLPNIRFNTEKHLPYILLYINCNWNER